MIKRAATELIDGPSGALEIAVELPTLAEGEAPLGLAVLAHPHPLMGGTMDNKVVTTLSRAHVLEGWVAVRFNFRGVGKSESVWDEGRGEQDDLLAVLAHCRMDPAWHRLPIALGGFSFGGFVAASCAKRLSDEGQALQALSLVSPATRFGVPEVPASTLVVQGEQDDVVPMADILDWARPQSLPVTVVPGVGHFFHGQLAVVRQIVRQYLQTHRPQAHVA